MACGRWCVYCTSVSRQAAVLPSQGTAADVMVDGQKLVWSHALRVRRGVWPRADTGVVPVPLCVWVDMQQCYLVKALLLTCSGWDRSWCRPLPVLCDVECSQAVVRTLVKVTATWRVSGQDRSWYLVPCTCVLRRGVWRRADAGVVPVPVIVVLSSQGTAADV